MNCKHIGILPDCSLLIASQESLMTTLIAHVSSLTGSCQGGGSRTDFRHFRIEIRLMQMILKALNNMPPRRTSAATARVVAVAVAAALMTAAVVEQLIEARVSATLANHETL
ncbi:hypothetical protein Tco_0748832 [Tanacetum coccineum]|uniref:Uncharacterized protein n=1 Tax=Tanacetum coccineum TaxID=301880 RepID=A0ABQ4YZ85_9ASTR